jgi:hypothetical protein
MVFFGKALAQPANIRPRSVVKNTLAYYVEFCKEYKVGSSLTCKY